MTERNIIECIVGFSNTNIKKLVMRSYYFGVLIIGYLSFLIGSFVSVTTRYNIRDASGSFSGMESNNVIWGTVVGIFVFIYMVIVLKTISELLLLIVAVLQAKVKAS